jgi:hypothetical protein
MASSRAFSLGADFGGREDTRRCKQVPPAPGVAFAAILVTDIVELN